MELGGNFGGLGFFIGVPQKIEIWFGTGLQTSFYGRVQMQEWWKRQRIKGHEYVLWRKGVPMLALAVRREFLPL